MRHQYGLVYCHGDHLTFSKQGVGGGGEALATANQERSGTPIVEICFHLDIFASLYLILFAETIWNCVLQ